MSGYDLIFLIFLGFAAWKGFRKGFIREMAGFVGLFLAAGLAWMWMGNLGSMFENMHAGNLPALPVMSFALLFGVFVLGFSLFARFVTKLLDMTVVLGLMNRVAGAALSGLQVLLIFMLLTWLADRTGIIPDSVKKDSVVYPVTSSAEPLLYHFSEKYFPTSEDWMDALKRVNQEEVGYPSED